MIEDMNVDDVFRLGIAFVVCCTFLAVVIKLKLLKRRREQAIQRFASSSTFRRMGA